MAQNSDSPISVTPTRVDHRLQIRLKTFQLVLRPEAGREVVRGASVPVYMPNGIITSGCGLLIVRVPSAITWNRCRSQCWNHSWLVDIGSRAAARRLVAEVNVKQKAHISVTSSACGLLLGPVPLDQIMDATHVALHSALRGRNTHRQARVWHMLSQYTALPHGPRRSPGIADNPQCGHGRSCGASRPGMLCCGTLWVVRNARGFSGWVRLCNVQACA